MNQFKARGGADMPNWLQMHRGGQVIVDRKNGTSVFSPRSAVSIVGTIQPRILASTMNEQTRACGAAARMLLAMLPKRRRVWTDATVSDATYQQYDRLVRGLHALWWNGEPVLVPLSDDARKLFIDFFNDWNREAEDLGDDLAAAWAKLEAYAPRFALIDHLVRSWDNVQPSPIDVTSMTNGVALARWFGAEAQRTYAVMAEVKGNTEIIELIGFIQKAGGRVKPKEVHKWKPARYQTCESAELALRSLGRRGTWQIVQPTPTGGRPETWFVLMR
jgi:hypothetical protein